MLNVVFLELQAWCLFELLFQLIKQCPYESMRGKKYLDITYLFLIFLVVCFAAMLFEVVKAVLQVQASAQHTQNTEMAMRTKKMSTVAKTKLFRSEVQAIDTASQLLASLQPAVFDVRSVASRYSSLTSSSFHQAIFSPSSSSLAIATIFFSPVGMEYFLLHFMRDCCLESFVGVSLELSTNIHLLLLISSVLLLYRM